MVVLIETILHILYAIVFACLLLSEEDIYFLFLIVLRFILLGLCLEGVIISNFRNVSFSIMLLQGISTIF